MWFKYNPDANIDTSPPIYFRVCLIQVLEEMSVLLGVDDVFEFPGDNKVSNIHAPFKFGPNIKFKKLRDYKGRLAPRERILNKPLKFKVRFGMRPIKFKNNEMTCGPTVIKSGYF